MVEYVKNKEFPDVIKPTEIADEYLATGEWNKATEKEYKATFEKEKKHNI